MNRIRLLPEHVANQIAAGEVVERPASVVKELVENALDAKSTRISVEIQAGGRSLVRVSDDGLGMSRDDALLCLERHATSKITRAEDLSAISTMGFRGEALPSIASVSRFTLNTREHDGTIEGTEIVVNGGKIVAVKAGGGAPGTSVEVRQLFFNLPARRKFLRSEETESAHIQHYLTLAALAYPAVTFEFIKDGRMIWQLPGVKAEDKIAALRERLRGLYGADQKLLPVTFTGNLPIGASDEDNAAEEPAVDPALRVWGVIGAPGVSRSTRDEQHVFVNRRPVENRGINFALLEGYHTALMKGKYPVCALFIELDPSEVDVNIHPAKREVKFHHERAVRHIVADAVRKALLDFHTPAAVAKPEPKPAPAPLSLEPQAPAAPEHEPIELPNFPKLSKPLPNWPAPLPKSPEPSTLAVVAPPDQPVAHPHSSIPVPLLHVPLRLVGVIGKLYVVLESDRGLVLLDQHAAHERILFEQMLQRLEHQGTAPSQRLLLPETVELAARDTTFLREQLPTLTRLGVGLSEFGERTFLLDALPPFVKVSDPRRFILQLVDELKSVGQGVNTLRLGEHVIAKTVCRHAVKANDTLAGPELENLIEDLRHCQMPYTCPHGRPTIIEMNFKELEKKFGRTV
ncbi:MAG: mismatch repair protein mutL [Verrucomicrobiales bacterium]|nr:mismatch repair protein mutL [Verrucomicrobiales bacterium]